MATIETSYFGHYHLDGHGASLFRDSTQMQAVIAKLGVAAYFDGAALADDSGNSIQRARITTAGELLAIAVVGLNNGKGLARISDACRVLSAPEMDALTGLMTAARGGYDAIDAWLAA